LEQSYTHQQVQKIINDHRAIIHALLQKEATLKKQNQELTQENAHLKQYVQQHLVPPTRFCSYIN
jgi:septal ring factor EnvC (AmiA/AmiB activator)